MPPESLGHFADRPCRAGRARGVAEGSTAWSGASLTRRVSPYYCKGCFTRAVWLRRGEVAGMQRWAVRLRVRSGATCEVFAGFVPEACAIRLGCTRRCSAGLGDAWFWVCRRFRVLADEVVAFRRWGAWGNALASRQGVRVALQFLCCDVSSVRAVTAGVLAALRSNRAHSGSLTG